MDRLHASKASFRQRSGWIQTARQEFAVVLGAICALSFCLAGASVLGAEVKLKDGSLLKGEILSASPAEVVVRTAHGLLRVQSADLTPESRAELGLDGRGDAAFYQRRVADLEAELARLRAENQSLRQQLAGQGTTGASPRLVPEPSSGSAATAGGAMDKGECWLSSTGKRHNSSCRYFRTTKGRPCGAGEGVACKICGG